MPSFFHRGIAVRSLAVRSPGLWIFWSFRQRPLKPSLSSWVIYDAEMRRRDATATRGRQDQAKTRWCEKAINLRDAPAIQPSSLVIGSDTHSSSPETNTTMAPISFQAGLAALAIFGAVSAVPSGQSAALSPAGGYDSCKLGLFENCEW